MSLVVVFGYCVVCTSFISYTEINTRSSTLEKKAINK